MLDDPFDLGTVTAPSGLLVLGEAAWADYWPKGIDDLAARAEHVGQAGVHLQGGCEAIVVSAGAGPLPARAETALPPTADDLVITVLEVSLGVPWPSGTAREPVRVGDLPVSRTGMILGDAAALDSYVGDGDDSVDGLADIMYWGKHAEEARAVFGGDAVPSPGNSYGWLDVPLEEAEALEDSLAAWVAEHHQGIGLLTAVDEHTDYTRLDRATWGRPLGAGTMDLAGCQVLGIMWDGLDHARRHRPERRGGCVYPVTLEPDDAGGTVLRWIIPPGDDDPAWLQPGGRTWSPAPEPLAQDASCDDDRMTDRWPAIDDDIVRHRMLPALTALREEFGYSTPEAIDAFSERYEHLRKTRPQDFTVSREDYGKNFYS